jgi:hypothetical protein
MRRRYQKGSLQLRKQGGVWVWLGMWREGEHRRTKTLGQKSEMTKAEAKAVLDRILAPLNARQEPQTGKMQLGAYIRDVYYPFCRRKWKRSTRMTTEDRINHHIVPEVGDSALRSMSRVVLQDLLDRKAADGLSFSVVTHLRWDLRHMFRIAVGEGFIERNPAELLFTPQAAKRATQRVAAAEEIARVFASVDLRERLILKLAGIAGMRPGEIFGLKWTLRNRRSRFARRHLVKACFWRLSSGERYALAQHPMLGCSLRRSVQRRFVRTTCGGVISGRSSRRWVSDGSIFRFFAGVVIHCLVILG